MISFCRIDCGLALSEKVRRALDCRTDGRTAGRPARSGPLAPGLMDPTRGRLAVAGSDIEMAESAVATRAAKTSTALSVGDDEKATTTNRARLDSFFSLFFPCF